MKKRLLIILSLLIATCALTACSEKSTSDEVLDKLGFSLGVPGDAEKVEYYILDGDTEELTFTLNGLDYTARLKRAASFKDISGLKYDWTDTVDFPLNGCECKSMRYLGDSKVIDLCLWYDETSGLMYSLTTSDKSLDGFDICAIALKVYQPITKFAGEYNIVGDGNWRLRIYEDEEIGYWYLNIYDNKSDTGIYGPIDVVGDDYITVFYGPDYYTKMPSPSWKVSGDRFELTYKITDDGIELTNSGATLKFKKLEE
ncbi:MAG: hypothetical protein MJ146_02390 [Clostridia bacterium]|nr:hypothetical protein [Clostridia bacterium]